MNQYSHTKEAATAYLESVGLTIKTTGSISLDDALSQICAHYGEESFEVILDALKRQDDYCAPGAYTNAIHDWVAANPKERNSYDPK